ncbi:MAG: ankyrin repeat domain-containing protein [Planctomycetota bacterium]
MAANEQKLISQAIKKAKKSTGWMFEDAFDTLKKLKRVPSVEEALGLASLLGDAKLLEACLIAGAKPASAAKWGLPDQCNCIKLLLEAGIDPNIRSQKQNSSGWLEIVAFRGKAKDAQLLLVNGIDVDQRGMNNETALIRATKERKSNLVKVLLQHGADVHLTDEYGATALTYAGDVGDDAITEMLLSHGAKVNLGGHTHYEPLVRAVYGKGPKRLKCVKLLVEAGALTNFTKENGGCLLASAAYSGGAETCQYLIDIGMPVDGHDGQSGPLISSIDSDDTKSLEVLVQAGAKLDSQLPINDNGPLTTPLEYAKLCRKRKAINIITAALAGSPPSLSKTTKQSTAHKNKVFSTSPKQNAADISSAWIHIEAWLKDHAPETRHSLNRKATDKQLIKAQATIGYKFPEELANYYQRHNGQKENAPCLVPADYASDVGYLLLSLAQAIQEWKMCNELTEAGEFRERKADVSKGIRSKIWHSGWLPIGSNGGGDYLCVDLDPTKAGKAGQVLSLNHESQTRLLVAKSIKEWLINISEALETGDWVPE